MKAHFLVVLLLWGSAVHADKDDSEEELENGVVTLNGNKVVGERFSPKKGGKNGHVYYGLRYGTSQRFKHSTLNDDFSYLKNSSLPKLGYLCPQVPWNMPGIPERNLTMNEDCLFLDVYIPPRKDDQKNLPVLMWIHGGGYQFGDKDLYNSSELSVAVNAIVVTINYRLSAFGFLSTGDDASPGNYAVGDAKVAVQWIKKYISNFGGDPAAISIFGESAGGGMVSLLFLDDNIRSVLRAGIAMSGSALAPWSLGSTQTSLKYAEQLGTEVGCANDTSAVLVECLSQIPQQRIIKAAEKLAQIGLNFRYVPVVDGKHVKELPIESIPNQKKTASKEGTFITGFLKEDASLLLMFTAQQIFNTSATFDHAAQKSLVREYVRHSKKCPEIGEELLTKVLDHYNVSESDNRLQLTQKLFWIATDAQFGYPPVKEAFLYANRTFASEAPNQFYLVSFDPKYSGLGAFHAMDIVFLFGGHLEMLMRNHTLDEEVRTSLLNMVRDVAHTGRMSGANFGTDGSYLELGQSKKWEKGTQSLADLVQFWDSVAAAPCKEAT